MRTEPDPPANSTAAATPTFAALQRRLVERLRDSTPEAQAGTIVVCPSLSFPLSELRKITGIQFYEERLLFLVTLLEDPDVRMVYLTSVPIDPAVVDYYLGWLPDPASARRRLRLVTAADPATRPLTDKLLERPTLLSEVRDWVGDLDAAFILPFNVTPSEAHLSEALGVALYGTAPDLVPWGSKTGGRRIAREAGVPVFPGAEGLRSIAEVEAAVQGLRRERPDARAAVAKLNNGFSGQGNLILDLAGLTSPLQQTPAVFCAEDETWESYARKVAAEGAIVEQLARTPGLASPSVQLRVLPGGRVEILSTHEQVLGGPDDQVYLGCRFPAAPEHRVEIQRHARRVGEALADKGVLGAFGIDFVVVPGEGAYLSEINLRFGGTTHPFLMARYVTGGTYDEATGELLVDGVPMVYRGGDNEKSERYRGLRPEAVIAAVAEAGLAYDRLRGSGATLHLLGALPEFGKWGLVAIARTHEEADALYEKVVTRVDALTGL